MHSLAFAFKEWAVICRALALGRQSIILRKGGIAEVGGSFRVEHQRFWLYPTFVHQQRDGIVADAQDLLVQAEAERPPEHQVRLSHFAEVAAIFDIPDLQSALSLEGLHLWSRSTVEARFAYRRPGLSALAVRIYRASTPVVVTETPEYAGCRSWVDLANALSTEGATPILDDGAFEDVRRRLLSKTVY